MITIHLSGWDSIGVGAIGIVVVVLALIGIGTVVSKCLDQRG